MNQIKSKEQLVSELKKFLGKETAIHYHCEVCGDEQVIYEEEITENMIE